MRKRKIRCLQSSLQSPKPEPRVEWVTDGEREGEREAAKVGQREMDLLAQVVRRRRAVIISKGQKGIRRGRKAG